MAGTWYALAMWLKGQGHTVIRLAAGMGLQVDMTV